jgi:ArsR family metal-binding transcriptional regulator
MVLDLFACPVCDLNAGSTFRGNVLYVSLANCNSDSSGDDECDMFSSKLLSVSSYLYRCNLVKLVTERVDMS